MEQAEIKEFGNSLGIKIFAETSGITDSLIKEVKILGNLEIPQQVFGFMVLESMLFSVYYFTRKFKSEFSDLEFVDFYNSALEGAGFGFTKLFLDKTKDHKTAFKNFQRKADESYAGYKGVITELFRNKLVEGMKAFNWKFNDKILDAYIEAIAKIPMEANFHQLKEEFNL